MGDHRASIKIEFSMHGHTDKCDMWINYHPENGVGGREDYRVDHRVLNWLTNAYDAAMDRWFNAQCNEDQRRQAEIENEERKQLAALKQKYESD